MMSSKHYGKALERASEVLGNEERAAEWLEKNNGALGCAPNALLDDEAGLDRVLLHLHQIEISPIPYD